MADIKITQQMIDFYRSKPGNSVLLDSAIIDLINKDIEFGKLPKEFITLVSDTKKIGYNVGLSNLFGYGFNADTSMGVSFEKTISSEELEYKKNEQMANNIVENLLKNTSGWNDLEVIKAEVKKINNPEIYELVNKILEEKGYKSSSMYSSLEKFLYKENNHFMIESSDLNIIWDLFDNGALTRDEKNNMNFRAALRHIRDGKVNLEEKEHIKFLLDYIDYTDAKTTAKQTLAIFNAIAAGGYKNDVYLEDMKKMLLSNMNKVSHTVILDSVQKRIEETTGFLSFLVNKKTSSNLDGKVDTDFKQGRVGDCWLLAAIKGVISNDTTRSVLERDCLKQDENGNLIVKLLGVGKEYIITREELKANAHFSSGEDDVRAIEIAFEKFFIENNGYRNRYEKEGITGGYESDACKILLGDIVSIRENRFCEFTEEKINQFNSENLICFVSAHGKDKEGFFVTENDEEYSAKKIVPGHAYYVVKADSKNVYLTNPWDVSLQISVPRETFKDFFNKIEVCELNTSV